MARLEAVSKMLYYPTDDDVVRLIAKKVTPPNGARRIFDPCAGEGRALKILADAWGLEPYGVELHQGRAATARSLGLNVLTGSIHALRAPDHAFGVHMHNPPYDDGQDSAGRSLRQEIQFLRTTMRLLPPNGMLLAVLPEPVIQHHDFEEMARRYFASANTFRFPDPVYASFKQHLVVATRLGSRETSGCHYNARDYEIPVMHDHMADVFDRYWSHYRKDVSESDLCEFEIEPLMPETVAPRRRSSVVSLGTGCYSLPAWRAIVEDPSTFDLKPVLPVRPGHRANLLAAGCLDGAELEPGVLVKGSSKKVIVTTIDAEEEVKYETDKLVSKISTLDLKTGDLTVIDTREESEKAVAWFNQHSEAIGRVMETAYPPAFDGDLTRYEPIFAKLQAPGLLPGKTKPEILPAQKMIAAAGAWLYSQGRNSYVISGKQGTGKTTMGSCISAIIGAYKTVILCPGHLVGKWLRESNKITGWTSVTGKSPTDIDNFFANPEYRFLILSRDTAKLGARWRPRALLRTTLEKLFSFDGTDPKLVSRKKKAISAPPIVVSTSGDEVRARVARINRDERSITQMVACPKCGAFQTTKDDEGNERPTTFVDLEKKKTTCSAGCGEQLWEAIPISSAGTKRWAPARYINQHYRRRYFFIADEAHQYAGADSDQSRASQHLASSAWKSLWMTGTLYGGKASSIFHLLYKVDALFREMYRYDAVQEFVRIHGFFEKITKLDVKTSTYGTKRDSSRLREIPGAAPSMIRLLLNHTGFIDLPDLGVELPPFSEQVVLLQHHEDVTKACKKMMDDCRGVLKKHPRILGAYLQAVLGYPDRPDQEERIVDTDRWGNDEIITWAPSLDRPCPKDEFILDLVRREVPKGRGVLVYFSQTHRRDARGRVKDMLEANGFRVAVLEASVSPNKREEWVQRAMGGPNGAQVMLTNGALVETGLDLMWAHEIVDYGIDYNIRRLSQKTRRSWRLGQTKEIRVHYLAYSDTAQEPALGLIAKKKRATEMMDGDETGGLAEHDAAGHDMLLELAREIVDPKERTQKLWTPAAEPVVIDVAPDAPATAPEPPAPEPEAEVTAETEETPVQEPVVFLTWVREPHSRALRNGTANFSHLIRAADDPDESRARGGNTDTKAWRKLMSNGTMEEWVERIRAHMADGVARTFNRLMVEISGFTADVAFSKAPDAALWHLVATGELAHTLEAPILFSATAEANAVFMEPSTKAPVAEDKAPEDEHDDEEEADVMEDVRDSEQVLEDTAATSTPSEETIPTPAVETAARTPSEHAFDLKREVYAGQRSPATCIKELNEAYGLVEATKLWHIAWWDGKCASKKCQICPPSVGVKPKETKPEPKRVRAQPHLVKAPVEAPADSSAQPDSAIEKRPKTGQSAPARSMEWTDFNVKEQALITGLLRKGSTMTLAELAQLVGNNNSHARNSLRRPVVANWIQKIDAGVYQLHPDVIDRARNAIGDTVAA